MMWPFSKRSVKVAEPRVPDWWDAYPTGTKLRYLGVDVVVTGISVDFDIGVLGLHCDYVDGNGVIRTLTLRHREMCLTERVST